MYTKNIASINEGVSVVVRHKDNSLNSSRPYEKENSFPLGDPSYMTLKLLSSMTYTYSPAFSMVGSQKAMTTHVKVNQTA